MIERGSRGSVTAGAEPALVAARSFNRLDDGRVSAEPAVVDLTRADQGPTAARKRRFALGEIESTEQPLAPEAPLEDQLLVARFENLHRTLAKR